MRIGIAGLGLIGGSLALALHGRHDVRGYDVLAATRDAAKARGVATADTLAGILPADLVIVATPLPAVVPTLATLAPLAGDAVLADVASVRAPVDAFARDGAAGARVVGLHPMAGRTASGFEAADAALFRGRPMLVVPTPNADDEATRRVSAVARDTGAVPLVCTGRLHDQRVAITSALPLAVASALAAVGEELGDALHSFAGPGYVDTTRLADTPRDLAEGILLANAANVIGALARMRGALDALEGAIAERDVTALRTLLERAAAVRARVAQDSAASIS